MYVCKSLVSNINDDQSTVGRCFRPMPVMIVRVMGIKRSFSRLRLGFRVYG